MLNHSKYLAEMFVVSKINPISYFHLGIRFPGFAKGFFVPFSEVSLSEAKNFAK